MRRAKTSNKKSRSQRLLCLSVVGRLDGGCYFNILRVRERGKYIKTWQNKQSAISQKSHYSGTPGVWICLEVVARSWRGYNGRIIPTKTIMRTAYQARALSAFMLISICIYFRNNFKEFSPPTPTLDTRHIVMAILGTLHLMMIAMSPTGRAYIDTPCFSAKMEWTTAGDMTNVMTRCPSRSFLCERALYPYPDLINTMKCTPVCE